MQKIKTILLINVFFIYNFCCGSFHAYNPVNQSELDDFYSQAKKSNPEIFLFDAAKDGDIEYIKQAIRLGIDVNQKTRYGNPGYNPNDNLQNLYHVNLRLGNLNASLAMYIANSKIYSMIFEKYNAIMCAATQGHTNIVQLLLDQPGIAINEKYENLTALDYATKNKHLDIAYLIKNKINEIKTAICELTKQKMDINIQQKLIKSLALQINTFDIADTFGNTPLHLALSNNNIELAKWYLSIKPILIAKKNKAGQNPIELAIAYGHFDFIKKLIKNGERKLEKQVRCLNCEIL